MPVSTSARPDVVSMSRQLRAWSSRRLSSISSLTRLPQSTHGTGPSNVPASDLNVPAWISATLVPPPRSRAQSTASFIAMTSLARDHGKWRHVGVRDQAQRALRLLRARAGAGDAHPLGTELPTKGEALSLISGPDPLSVQLVGTRRHSLERELA